MKRAKGWLGCVIAAGCLVAPSTSLAGSGRRWEVQVEADNAGGSMGSVFHSADSLQRIGCRFYTATAAAGGYTYVYCHARNREGKSVYCFASSEALPSFTSALAAATSESYLRFAFDTSARCTSIQVDVSSEDPPK